MRIPTLHFRHSLFFLLALAFAWFVGSVGAQTIWQTIATEGQSFTANGLVRYGAGASS